MRPRCPKCSAELSCGDPTITGGIVRVTDEDLKKHNGIRHYCTNCGWYSLNSYDGIVAFDIFGNSVVEGDMVVVPYLESTYAAPELIVGMVSGNKVIHLEFGKYTRFVYLTSKKVLQECKIIKLIPNQENIKDYSSYRTRILTALSMKKK